MRTALTSPVSLLTGGPGTGKTHTLKGVLTLARAKGLRCVLAAPTGRAAKRMEEATSLPAATLHRLLELRPGGKAGRDRQNPLPADLVVVDETSMLDALLANQLVKAVPRGPTCSSSATPISSPASAPETSWPTCSASPRAGAPRCTPPVARCCTPSGPSAGGPGLAHWAGAPPPPSRSPACSTSSARAPAPGSPSTPATSTPGRCPASGAPSRTASSSPPRPRRRPPRPWSTSSPGASPPASASAPARSRCSPHAPRRGRRGGPQRPAPGAPQPRPARPPRAARGRAHLPPRRPRPAAQERLRPQGLQRRPGHRPRRGRRGGRAAPRPGRRAGDPLPRRQPLRPDPRVRDVGPQSDRGRSSRRW